MRSRKQFGRSAGRSATRLGRILMIHVLAGFAAFFAAGWTSIHSWIGDAWMEQSWASGHTANSPLGISNSAQSNTEIESTPDISSSGTN